jgi:hypothetical protein
MRLDAALRRPCIEYPTSPAALACLANHAEALRAEQCARFGGDESQMRYRHRCDAGRQFGMDRDHHRAPGLELLDRDRAVPNVLGAHDAHVAAPLGGVERQIESQALLCPTRPVGLELRDVLFLPCRVAELGLDPDPAHDRCRIVRPPAQLDRELEELPEPLAQIVRRTGRPAHLRDQVSNVLRSHLGGRTATVLRAEPLDLAAIGVLGRFLISCQCFDL